MEEEYEYANELVKQGVKNPRQVYTKIHYMSHISTPTQ